jgi:GR25 family glycosyltransferase involved in LPS biosynthesis
MPYKIWPSYDGSSGTIIEPDHLKENDVMSMIKVTNRNMQLGEICACLGHISLWAHCIKINRPIVILEHDAVMIKRIKEIESYNAVVYLGGLEWAKKGWKICPIPPHATMGPNYSFICRAHAYAIDPIVAKNLLAYILQEGIHAPNDCMIKATIFNIAHQGLYAYDDENESTIIRRNDGLVNGGQWSDDDR